MEQSDGQTMRAEIPTRVNARAIPLIAETKAIVGERGRVTVIWVPRPRAVMRFGAVHMALWTDGAFSQRG